MKTCAYCNKDGAEKPQVHLVTRARNANIALKGPGVFLHDKCREKLKAEVPDDAPKPARKDSLLAAPRKAKPAWDMAMDAILAAEPPPRTSKKAKLPKAIDAKSADVAADAAMDYLLDAAPNGVLKAKPPKTARAKEDDDLLDAPPPVDDLLDTTPPPKHYEARYTILEIGSRIEVTQAAVCQAYKDGDLGVITRYWPARPEAANYTEKMDMSLYEVNWDTPRTRDSSIVHGFEVMPTMKAKAVAAKPAAKRRADKSVSVIPDHLKGDLLS